MQEKENDMVGVCSNHLDTGNSLKILLVRTWGDAHLGDLVIPGNVVIYLDKYVIRWTGLIPIVFHKMMGLCDHMTDY